MFFGRISSTATESQQRTFVPHVQTRTDQVWPIEALYQSGAVLDTKAGLDVSLYSVICSGGQRHDRDPWILVFDAAEFFVLRSEVVTPLHQMN